MNNAEKLKRIQQLKNPQIAIAEALTLIFSLLEIKKGDPGYSPVFGKDYFTDHQIAWFIQQVQKNIRNGKDGKDGRDGKDGCDGKDADIPFVVSQVLRLIEKPKDGKDGRPGKDGRDGATPSENDILAVLNKVLSNNSVNIKELSQLIEFLKRGGFRGGGGGFVNPLSTKGDILVWGTTGLARLPVGTDGQVLIADSTQALGLRYGPGGGSGSGITRSIFSITTNQTAAATALTDYVYNISSGAILTMPTVVGNTNRYTIKNTDASPATVSAAGGQTIEGAASITLNTGDAVDLISDGVSNWGVY